MTAAAAAADAWLDDASSPDVPPSSPPPGPGPPDVKPGAVLPDDEAETIALIAELQKAADLGDDEIDLQATYEADSTRLKLRFVRDLSKAKLERVKRALGERRPK